MTCNHQWPEIQNALLPGAKWHHRPEIVARVFMYKMHELIDDLVRNNDCDTVKAYVISIEWQSRGLPHHCHISECKNAFQMTELLTVAMMSVEDMG